jgi:hypothetical protein
VAQLVFGGMFVVIGVFVAAGILHLMLLLLNGATQKFEATFRVISFAQTTSLLLLVPFCGQIVAGVAKLWTLVLYVLGLAPAHRIGHGKAAAAVFLPVLSAAAASPCSVSCSRERWPACGGTAVTRDLEGPSTTGRPRSA